MSVQDGTDGVKPRRNIIVCRRCEEFELVGTLCRLVGDERRKGLGHYTVREVPADCKFILEHTVILNGESKKM